ncbi:MAG: hypothetical protein IC227_06275 [Enterococcus lacertideformus]|uniref:Uncharacterized protein n=1 Tax=Enterococcus lacertideformus TaxID=2771493 RepID=A0A931AYD8_9ENTE|nr:hypothetical protein [Enterococcus lacertideformus]
MDNSFKVSFELEHFNRYLKELGTEAGLKVIKNELILKDCSNQLLSMIVEGLHLPLSVDKEDLKKELIVGTEIENWNSYLESMIPEWRWYTLKKHLLSKEYSQEILFQIIEGIEPTKLPPDMNLMEQKKAAC